MVAVRPAGNIVSVAHSRTGIIATDADAKSRIVTAGGESEGTEAYEPDAENANFGFHDGDLWISGSQIEIPEGQ